MYKNEEWPGRVVNLYHLGTGETEARRLPSLRCAWLSNKTLGGVCEQETVTDSSHIKLSLSLSSVSNLSKHHISQL